MSPLRCRVQESCIQVRGARSTMMINALQLWHRAAKAGSMRQMNHKHSPAAAVRQIIMPGRTGELGTITWSAAPRVSAQPLCSPGGVARRRNS